MFCAIVCALSRNRLINSAETMSAKRMSMPIWFEAELVIDCLKRGWHAKVLNPFYGFVATEWLRLYGTERSPT